MEKEIKKNINIRVLNSDIDDSYEKELEKREKIIQFNKKETDDFLSSVDSFLKDLKGD